MYLRRFEHLQLLMHQHHLEAIALNPGPTLTYLTGLHFHLMERPTILVYRMGQQPIIILPELEQAKLAGSSMTMSTVAYNDDPATWPKIISQGLEALKLENASIGVEATRIRYLELSYLQQAAPGAGFISAEHVLGELRITKDTVEITEMRRAVAIAQQSLQDVIPQIKPGITEKELAAELTVQLLRNGSDPELPFQPIVAGGPNSANPHAVPTDRPLQRGDLLVIDWGARSNGYCSDLTRTFAICEIKPEFKKIYETVQLANAAGRAAGKQLTTAGLVDQAARTVIDEAGFGSYFTHRTGHGIGLEDHESPYIYNGNPQQLHTGMTYTVEPGIYVPGQAGVRIEDDMVVTAEGSESLSDLPRDLIIL